MNKLLLACAALMAFAPSMAVAADSDAYVGAYLMLPRKDSDGNLLGLEEMRVLAEHADTIPVNRIWLAFFGPTMVYEPDSHTLEYTWLNVSYTDDYGFAEIKNYTSMLQAGGVEVFLSMGGWNYNCFPYFYMRYSVGGYGTDTPNYWKIEKFGDGDMKNCNAANQYCYVCEPPSEGTSLDDFQIFPEPSHSDTWAAAKKYVAEGAKTAGVDPIWNEDMAPGSRFTDSKTGIEVKVPGNNMYINMGRDPYQDIVYLAKDLGADGIDLDYEEFWHADTFKTGSGPWNLTQTVYKYAAVAMDLATNIKAIQPSLKLSTAGGAVGAWQGNWWGGNLKGLWYYASLYFPFVMEFMSKGDNAGGINVMSYDLSSNTHFHECPEDDTCPLDKQVDFYMKTYTAASIPAAVGYEISTPAYPDKDEDPTHQLPLTKEMLSSIISTTQPNFKAGFFWELYKPVDNSDHASPTDVAQAVCKAVLGSDSRCSGTIPSTNSTGGNDCSPSECNVCDACCKSYLSDQTACDQCVSSECAASNVCSADSTCTTCSACCKSYITTQSVCDQCVQEECSSNVLHKRTNSALMPEV